jgi:exo-beta-1,3-glucanase (GH17 family)
MGWYVVKMQRNNNDTLSKMGEALNNNTIALTKLAEKIDTGRSN